MDANIFVTDSLLTIKNMIEVFHTVPDILITFSGMLSRLGLLHAYLINLLFV